MLSNLCAKKKTLTGAQIAIYGLVNDGCLTFAVYKNDDQLLQGETNIAKAYAYYYRAIAYEYEVASAEEKYHGQR